jgi:hypothetical protein
MFGRNVYPCPGLRIPADTRLPLSRPEASESSDLNFVSSTQRTNDAIEDGLDNYFGILPGHLDHTRYLFDQLRLRHIGSLFSVLHAKLMRRMYSFGSPARGISVAINITRVRGPTKTHRFSTPMIFILPQFAVGPVHGHR